MLSFSNWRTKKNPTPPIMRKRRYRFFPQPDITAYELALILKNVVPAYPGAQPFARDIEVDPMTVDRDWYLVMRHFAEEV